MKQTIIIGAGGQCRAVLGIVKSIGMPMPACIYDSKALPGELIMGLPVMPMVTEDMLLSLVKDYNFILAIGDNKVRQEWYTKLKNMGSTIVSLIAPSSVISDEANIGEGVVISSQAFVGPLATVGDNVILNTASIVEHEAVVGSHCHLAPASIVCGRTKIGNKCFIGANATLIDNISIATDTIVGAGSVVIKSITESGSTWVGAPAKKITK